MNAWSNSALPAEVEPFTIMLELLYEVTGRGKSITA